MNETFATVWVRTPVEEKVCVAENVYVLVWSIPLWWVFFVLSCYCCF